MLHFDLDTFNGQDVSNRFEWQAEPDYLGTSCSEADLRRRFQSLGETIGRQEALGLVLKEPLLLAAWCPFKES